MKIKILGLSLIAPLVIVNSSAGPAALDEEIQPLSPAVPNLQAKFLPYCHHLHLSWPASSPAISLWSAPFLGPAASWEPNQVAIVNNGTHLCAALPVARTAHFFQLKSSAPEISPANPAKYVLMFRVGTPAQEKEASLLLDSIQAYGGPFRTVPIYVVVTESLWTSAASLSNRVTRLVKLDMEPKHQSFPFADKVYACAQVEALCTRPCSAR